MKIRRRQIFTPHMVDFIRKTMTGTIYYCMITFFEWLKILNEESQRTVPPEILRGYDLEIRRRLEQLESQINDPKVRAQFQTLIACPLVDAKGSCRNCADYILGALIKNGVQGRYDLEQSIQYVFEKLLMPTSDSGEERNSLFTGFNPNTPDSAEHFRARFLSWVKFAVGNVKRGKVRRISNVEQRPQGTISIGQGRTKEYEPGIVSPDEIADRPSSDDSYTELVSDIEMLLRKKEANYQLPLVGIFRSIVTGQNTTQQKAQFGDSVTRAARPIIIRIIRDYAESTGNHHFLALLDRFKDFKANQPDAPRRTLGAKTVQPVMDTREKDYRSIASVVERWGKVGTSQLGSTRSRWLSYAPRDPSSGHKNRLSEVLDSMVRDGVLKATRTAAGAYMYSPGPNFHQYSSGVPSSAS